MPKDLSHIGLINAKQQAGPYLVDMVYLFNSEKISEEEVKDIIATEAYSKYALRMTLDQWNKIFENQ